MQDGLKASVYIPLDVIKTATKVWSPMVELAKVGNIKSKSDLQVEISQNILCNCSETVFNWLLTHCDQDEWAICWLIHEVSRGRFQTECLTTTVIFYRSFKFHFACRLVHVV